MFNIQILGLDKLRRVISNLATRLEESIFYAMEDIGYEIKGRILQKVPELGTAIDVWREVDGIYVAPRITDYMWKEYIKTLPEEAKGRAFVYRARCRHYLYQEPSIRKLTVKEYPALKVSPSILEETVAEVINDGYVLKSVREEVERLIQ